MRKNRHNRVGKLEEILRHASSMLARSALDYSIENDRNRVNAQPKGMAERHQKGMAQRHGTVWHLTGGSERE
jgi:isocitrate dehydrogenase